jgi:hypothetical protein
MGCPDPGRGPFAARSQSESALPATRRGERVRLVSRWADRFPLIAAAVLRPVPALERLSNGGLILTASELARAPVRVGKYSTWVGRHCFPDITPTILSRRTCLQACCIEPRQFPSRAYAGAL